MAYRFWTSRRFVQSLPMYGPTADRPTSPPIGFMYYDTTITKPCWWDGSNWKSAANAVV